MKSKSLAHFNINRLLPLSNFKDNISDLKFNLTAQNYLSDKQSSYSKYQEIKKLRDGST